MKTNPNEPGRPRAFHEENAFVASRGDTWVTPNAWITPNQGQRRQRPVSIFFGATLAAAEMDKEQQEEKGEKGDSTEVSRGLERSRTDAIVFGAFGWGGGWGIGDVCAEIRRVVDGSGVRGVSGIGGGIGVGARCWRIGGWVALVVGVSGVGGRIAVGLRASIGKLTGTPSETISVGSGTDLALWAFDSGAGIVDAASFATSLAGATGGQFARIVLAFSKVADLSVGALDSDARVGLASSVAAALSSGALFVGAGAHTLAPSAKLIGRTRDAVAGVGNALSTPANLVSRAFVFGVVAIVFDTESLVTEGSVGTLDVVAGIYAPTVTTDLPIGFALRFEVFTFFGSDTDAFSVQLDASLSGGAFGLASR